MLCFPNAKINIGLNIISKRNDGYHNIETVFLPVALYDILEFVPCPDKPSGFIELNITGINIEGNNENNLICKAYHLLHSDFSLPAITVHLHKIIPPGAGLGGGSSDGAFMLKHLNDYFHIGLQEEQLCHYASVLGSDCAFFVKNHPLFAFERGNLFREINQLPRFQEIIIVNPGIHISTAKAYAGIQPEGRSISLESLITHPVDKWKDMITNDFEKTILTEYPLIGEIKKVLYASGAIYASMSGSGSSVYGLFMCKAPDLKSKFPDYFYWSGPPV